jgi:RTX calcium-binding nonapeptide repeat (4 copies)
MSFFDQPSNSERSVRRANLTLEELERREVPAGLVTAAVIGGTLAVTGLNDGNPAAARLGLNNQTVVVTGAGIGSFDVSVLNGTRFTGTALSTLHFTGANAVLLDMGLGNDIVIVSNVTGFSRVVAFAGAGDDFIQVAGGATVVSEIYGGPGNDVLVGGLGLNILDGGDGNDQLFGGPGRDLLVGGFGFDTLIGGAGDDIEIGDAFMPTQSDLFRRVALNTALAHWNSTNSYSARVGATFSDLFVRVISDNSRDVLAGGLGQDWFLGRLSGQGSDLFFDRTPADELINLGSPLPSF